MTDLTPVHKGPDAALVYLDSGIIPVTRSAVADDIADAFREAAQHLREVEREASQREDIAAAKRLNVSWRRRNLTPVGTLTPTSTTITHVEPSTGCACSCSATCGADHGPETAA